MEAVTNVTYSGVLGEVDAERRRQDRRWGVQNHSPTEWAAVLGEEFGEACQAALDAVRAVEVPARPFEDQLRQELLQVAAVAVAWVEAIDRRRSGRHL